MRAVLLAICLAFVSACASSSATIHVAPDGDDNNRGAASQPVATLHAAQKLVREQIRLQHGMPIEVVIQPGTYELQKPLVLTPEDSGVATAPITWRAADVDDKPLLSAGSAIQGHWRPSDKPGVWYIDVPGTKQNAGGPNWNFRQLFVDGSRATRARFPNKDEDNPFIYAIGSGKNDHAVIDPALIKDGWVGETDAQINLVVHWLFFNQWNTIASIDKEAGKIYFTEDERHGNVYKNNWFYIEGVFAELDQPGEWYLNRELGRLYYIPEPGQDPNNMRFVAPRLDRIIHVRGDVNAGTHVEHVHFTGIEFRHTAFNLGHIAPRVHTDAAIRFENTLDSSVSGCHFQNIGGYAFWLHLDSQRNHFTNNTSVDSGGGGVLLTGARLSYMDDSKVYTPGEAASKVAPIRNHITHNTVKHCGRIRYYGGGVHLDSRPFNMAMLPGNYIAHNHFEDLSRNGIFAFRNQGGNIIEYNHIHDAMQTTIDGACIHLATMNYLSAPNYVLNNWLYDIWGYRYLPDKQPRRVLANGVFLDWETSDSFVKSNYVYNAGGAPIKQVWENRNNTIQDNHTSETRITPPFVKEVGPGGQATNGIDLESTLRIGRVVHYSDDALVKPTGNWKKRQIGGQGNLFTYNLLQAVPDKPAKITYNLPIPEDGNYRVSVLYKPDEANATNASITVHHAEGVSRLTWNMKEGHRHGFAMEIGMYPFEKGKPAKVVISNEGADGNVVADSIAFVKSDGADQGPD